ncbi:hypothetical protein FACS189425_09140 [Clostridia bacterium]|nr:hypothetical protein FACS189425_09140 [Clostridia bacterium]
MNDYPKSKDLKPASSKPKPIKLTSAPTNTTLYCEVVPTSFSWVSPDEQRTRAAKLEDFAD